MYKVITFNIGSRTSLGGSNKWCKKKKHIVEQISLHDADIIFLQEVGNIFQEMYLRYKFRKEYIYKSSKQLSNNVAILIKKDKFEVDVSQVDYLTEDRTSKTKGWDSVDVNTMLSMYVMDKDTRGVYLLMSVRFDQAGLEAQRQSADYIQRMYGIDNEIIIGGSLNLSESNGSQRALKTLRKSFKLYGGFKGVKLSGMNEEFDKNKLYDYILLHKNSVFEVIEEKAYYKYHHDTYNNRHFMMTAKINDCTRVQ